MWLVVVFLAGCAGPQTAPDEPAGPSEPAIEPGIYETQTGERVDEGELFELLAEQRFVVVGEKHDDPWHHEVQARIWRAVSERVPAALGMEMFQRPYQNALDAYVTGQIDEAEMLEQTEYEQRWGFPTDFYSPMWQSARADELPIVALNAPRELSRKVSEVGIDGLTEEERADVPDLDLSNEIHRTYVRRAFEQHDMELDDARFERFYTAQVLWDETMADTAVRFLRDFPDFSTMVILAGVAHADLRFGIPPRIERRLDADEDGITVVRPVNLTREPVESPEQFSDEADFVWVGTEESEKVRE